MTNENNNERHDDEEFEFTIVAEFGDLVSVEGYPDQVFHVEGYRCETSHYPDIVMSDMVYELSDAINNDYLEADAIDITFITDAGQADEYLRTIDRKSYPKPGAHWIGMLGDWGLGANINDLKGANEMAKNGNGEARKLTPRELSAKEADERKKGAETEGGGYR
ncbi:hypothetical protein GJU41_11750 [Bacillus idriensis]|uniref:Uncharacterized protein n=1 Tax=Metabacillus idriensis TaxID=324768 RepID=A0A6I2MC91_9BACI|nr:hypothetical protein [Metabacillus idriensis]MRX54646.1 hypothetical protein [Metabacillus idriensis]